MPEESHGRRSLVGCSPWGHWELDTTEWLHFHSSLSCAGEGNGSPLQCSCLENPRDGGAGWAAVYGVTQSRTRLKRLSSSSRNHQLPQNKNLGEADIPTESKDFKCSTFHQCHQPPESNHQRRLRRNSQKTRVILGLWCLFTVFCPQTGQKIESNWSSIAFQRRWGCLQHFGKGGTLQATSGALAGGWWQNRMSG